MISFGLLYEGLLAEYGRQSWWPAADPFEIMVGALLVQRTTWSNVERALAGLTSQQLLYPDGLAEAEIPRIERCIRSAGFFRIKAVRLQALAQYVQAANGIEGLARRSSAVLRIELLQLPGVGAETAAAILLYAFERPVVVIDAYLRRLAQRLHADASAPPDSEIEAQIISECDDVQMLNELHALIVEHGKQVCLKVPRCTSCCVRGLCRTGKAVSET